MSDGAVTTLHARTRTLQEPHLRRGRHAARLHQRSGGVRQAGLAVSSLSLEDRRRRAAELVSAATPGMPQGMVVSEHASPRFSKDGSRIFLGTAPPPPPPADPDSDSARADSGRPLVHQGSAAPADAARARRAGAHTAATARSCISPTSKFVQLATPDLPTVNPGDDPAQRDRDVRPALPARKCRGTRPTTTSSCSICKTGKPTTRARALGRNATTMSPGGKYLLLLRREQRPLVQLPGRRRRAREPDREARRCSFQQDNDTPDLPGAYGTGRLDRRRPAPCCSTTSSTSGK